jgi:hypothetical protein
MGVFLSSVWVGGFFFCIVDVDVVVAGGVVMGFRVRFGKVGYGVVW